MKHLFTAFVGILSLLLTLPAQAQTIRYVSTIGTNTDPASATSWATSTTNLQGAINASAVNDQVWVAAGTYKSTSTTDRTASFAMKNGVAIYGGFADTGNPVFADRNPGSFTTILSGDINNDNTLTGNSYHVINNPVGLTTSAVLDGFVITGGNASPNNLGGGMYNNGDGNGNVCSPTVRNCSFRGNTADYGGAMFNNGGDGFTGNSSPVLINCSFQENSALQGGALYNKGRNSAKSNPVLTNCSFQNNTATYGGAIFSDGNAICFCSTPLPPGSNPSLTNCVLFGNGNGNTFFNSSAILTATYTLFDNTVTGYGGSNNQTTTTSPFISNSSVALNACSKAINTGDPATTSATVGNSDLAGQPRFFNNEQIDMGAVEFQDNPGSPIAFTLSPASGSVVCAGSSVSTPVSLTGTGPLSYQWYKSGSPVVSQTAAALSLPSVTTANAGSYSVLVTGACNSVTSTAFNLTVNSLPNATITATPSAVLSCAQKSATLSVNQPGGSFRWSTEATTASISASVAGPYTITATLGSCSATESINVSGSVQGSPPSPLFVISGPCSATGLTITALGGNSYSFSGPADGSTGIISQFDGSFHTLVNGYLINQTPLPAIGTALINQTGTYTVLVTGDGGCTAIAMLTVSSLTCPNGR